MSNSVRVFAPAKVNLFLHVGDRRADGFHPLESLAVFVGVGDTLTLEKAGDLSLSLDGPFAEALGLDSENLVLRAARLLNKNARITLTKNLPVASGIGGGSADAAAALRGLNDLYGMHRTDLENVAAALGSDVPVCVASAASWMQGRGEILTPANVAPLALVLVNPGVGVSTADVFRTLKSRSGVGLRLDAAGDLLSFLKSTKNDLEAPALAIQPIISDVLDALAAAPGAQLARMSGSGATCFGIFEDEESAKRAARQLMIARPDWWVQATKTLQ